MFLLYADFGPNGAVIRTMTGSRKVGQYVVFSTIVDPTDNTVLSGIPIRAFYMARTIAVHNLLTDTFSWLKNRHVPLSVPIAEEEQKELLIQLLASEPW